MTRSSDESAVPPAADSPHPAAAGAGLDEGGDRPGDPAAVPADASTGPRPPDRPLTVGQFTDNYGPNPNGLLYAVQFLEQELLAAGHRVVLVAPESKGHNPLAGNPHRREIRLPSVPLPGTAVRVWNGRDFGYRLAQLVANPPDVIHVHGMGPTGLLGMWVAQRTDRPLVVTWHTDFEAYAEHYWHLAPFLNGIYKLYQARAEQKAVDKLRTFRPTRLRRGGAQMELLQRCADMLSEADVVTAPSDKTAKRIMEIAPSAKVRVVPNGVDPLPATAPLPRGRHPRLLFVGRVSQEKGVELLLDAFERVRDQVPNAELVIVGEWHEAAVMLRRRLVRASKRGGVTLAGQVDRDRLNAYYGSADAFVFPSVTDTQALVLHEAAHAGLPIVMVDPELNLVVDPGVNATIGRANPVSFAQAIVAMLRKLEDPEAKAKAQARSRELAAQWSSERQSVEVIALYEDLARGRPVRTSDHIVPDRRRRPFGGRRISADLHLEG